MTWMTGLLKFLLRRIVDQVASFCLTMWLFAAQMAIIVAALLVIRAVLWTEPLLALLLPPALLGVVRLWMRIVEPTAHGRTIDRQQLTSRASLTNQRSHEPT